MARKKVKRVDMLKMLSDDMKSMIGERKSSSLKDVLGDKGQMKATVVADSAEGLKEGLSKAEQIMKAKLGKKSEDSCECAKCGDSPCKCE